QAGALVVLQPARDAEALAVRHEDDEPSGQRDLHRQPRALRLHRVLDGLDEDLLPAAQQVLDALALAVALERRADDLVHVQKAVALEVDLGDAVVLEDRDALLTDVDGHEQLALRGRQRRAARRRATLLAAGGAVLALLCAPFFRLRPDRLGLLLRGAGLRFRSAGL